MPPRNRNKSAEEPEVTETPVVETTADETTPTGELGGDQPTGYESNDDAALHDADALPGDVVKTEVEGFMLPQNTLDVATYPTEHTPDVESVPDGSLGATGGRVQGGPTKEEWQDQRDDGSQRGQVLPDGWPKNKSIAQPVLEEKTVSRDDGSRVGQVLPADVK